MSWNYRLVKKVVNGHTGYEIHEVYYDKNGKPRAMTMDKVSDASYWPWEDDLKDDETAKENVLAQLAMMMKDVLKHPVFEEPDEWASWDDDEDEEEDE